MRESVMLYTRYFLLAIIIAPSNGLRIPADESARGTSSSRSVVFPSAGKTAYRFAPGAERFGVRANVHSFPDVTDERFYRTSRCSREACVILLSIPFSLVESHQTLLTLKYFFSKDSSYKLSIKFIKWKFATFVRI